jgi:hypothetical protein
MQSTTTTNYRAKIATVAGDFLKKASAAITGGNFTTAEVLCESAGDLLATMRTKTVATPGRGRPRKAASAEAPAAPTKIAMNAIPQLLAEKFPDGATYEQIRQLAGWKPTAPPSNVQRLLVNKGKLTLENGVYRAAA